MDQVGNDTEKLVVALRDFTKGLHESVLDVLFPRQCCLCGSEGRWWCEGCLSSLVAATTLQTVKLTHDISAFYAFTYGNEAIKTCIHELKYGGLADMASPVIRAVAMRFNTSLRALVGANPVWIPVPSSRRHLRDRGFSQTVELARAWASALGGTVWQEAIIHRSQSVQVGSTAAQRHLQAQGAFSWRGLHADTYRDGRWVLVDDVCTTGSTLAACYECLVPFSHTPITSLVLARQE